MIKRKDIESLNWEFICETHGDHWFIAYDYKHSNRYSLTVEYDGFINISDTMGEVSFIGNIENKTELKKLMKQLEIIDEK